MASNNIINVHLFGQEIGRIGMETDQQRSSFQYHPEFLESGAMQQMFPPTGIIKRTPLPQLFSTFNNDTFKGLPPQFADSLPDVFGSIVFKAWLERKQQQSISVLEQLAYVGTRGMGALEYSPVKKLPKNSSINISEIVEVLKEVLDLKKTSGQKDLSTQALINVFKIGTSAGGARPKILISEEKTTGQIIPGDLEYSDLYHHYLVKLAMDSDLDYPRERVEYCYALLARQAGIRMMETKLIDDVHFATLRFDRQNGEKQHVLTASGITGWDYRSPEYSSYENLFKLCSFLKIPHAQMEELFIRMVFNVLFENTDDHLKNHSFIYDRSTDSWELAPAYDITYALNPLLNYTRSQRALSINGKRNDIQLEDLLKLADDFTIKNPEGIVKTLQALRPELVRLLKEHDIPALVIQRMEQSMVDLV
ncbi:MAG: type II toxin-antitoxin system HipA family toxin [Flavobacteriales bacterium]|nr:type II toxin-antitoxin system HipA family toxin [Flavobacteriales bacterium]